MKTLLGIISLLIFFSCNSANEIKPKEKVNSNEIKDSLLDITELSDQHRDAQKDIIGTWRIYKDVSREGDKCDSVSIKDGSCLDKNTEMITLLTFTADGKYTLNSGFKGNHPSEDNGKWKLQGTKHGIDVLLFESYTAKSITGSESNAITTYIIQNVSFRHLVLIDAKMFNIMYFVSDSKNLK